MEIQREKDRVVEITNELKKARVIKKVHVSCSKSLKMGSYRVSE